MQSKYHVNTVSHAPQDSLHCIFVMVFEVGTGSVDKTLSCCVTIQMKATEQHFHVVLFIMLYKVVLTFKSVDETLVCDHSHESY